MLRKLEITWLILILIAETTSSRRSSGSLKSGICGGDLYKEHEKYIYKKGAKQAIYCIRFCKSKSLLVDKRTGIRPREN